jgi:hypothetical protein
MDDAMPACRLTSARATMLLAALALGSGAGCAGSPSKTDPGETAAYDPGEMAGMGRSPLAVFNVGEEDIPEVLLRAVADTYARPSPLDCATITAEVVELDATLGSDLDVVKAADRPNDIVYEAMAGALRGLIPYRSVIGYLSGARDHQRQVVAAVAAGATRRAYLKGLGESIGCTPPAAPLRAPPERP